jgi:hypothetical protein
VQVLAGGMTASANVQASIGSASSTFKDSATDPGVQVGGGMNIAATKNVGIRLNADFVRVFHEGGEHTNFFRLAAGAVVPFGKR